MFGSSSEEDDSDADESPTKLIPPAILAEMEKVIQGKQFEFLKEYDENIYEKYLLAVKTYVCCDYELLSTISAELISITYGLLKKWKGWPNHCIKDVYVLSQLFMAASHLTFKELEKCIQCIDKVFTLSGPSRLTTIYLSLIVPRIKSSNATKLLLKEQEIKFTNHLYAHKILIPNTAGNNKSIQKIHACSIEMFQKEYLNKEIAIILTDLLTKENGYEGAMSKWKDVKFWLHKFHYRVVPIEVGRFPQFCHGKNRDNTWNEEMVTIEEFFETYLIPSIERIRARELESDFNNLNPYAYLPDVNTVAYLAQHDLFEQFKSLKRDIGHPKYCHCYGRKVEKVNIWFGTDGTVTPLHFDSYDNFLMQVIGFKYVRLYDKSETKYLYCDDTSIEYAQGNMTNVSVEYPDEESHPKFFAANYTETILKPGETLFIPSGMWHYVRSLTPSLSINYWF